MKNPSPLVTSILSLSLYTQVFANFDWYERGEIFRATSPYSKIGMSVATSHNGKIVSISSPEYSKEIYYGQRNGAVRSYIYGQDESTDSTNDNIDESEKTLWFPLGPELVGEEYQEFGQVVDLSSSGFVLAVGSPTADVEGVKSAGQVQIFVLDHSGTQTEWVPMGNIIKGSIPFDETGSAVALSENGKVLAVGSPGFDVVDTESEKVEVGQVQVYEYMNMEAQWRPRGGSLVGIDAFDRFGSSIGMSDDGLRVAIGAPDGGSNRAGYVQVVEFDSITGEWTIMGLTLPGSESGDRFGSSLSMSSSGDRFVVGAPRHRGPNSKYHAGQVRAFLWDTVTETWGPFGIEVNGLSDGDELGTSVDISSNGNSFIVGAPKSSRNGNKNCGHAVVYHWSDSDSDWDKMGFDMEGNEAFDGLGQSVSISGDGLEVIVGAPDGGYALSYHLLETRAPTQAPINDSKSKGPSVGVRRFGKFVQIIIILAISTLAVFGAFRGYQYLKRKREARSIPVPGNDLEMTADVAVQMSIESDLRRAQDDTKSENELL
jgi:hypothetical protein